MKSSILRAHLQAAKAYSQLSHAHRLKVGAVLVRDDRIISVGLNGMPSGGTNQCETLGKDGKSYTKKEVIHAEQNLISFAAKNGISTNGCVLVSTHSPCFECAKLIIQSGIKEVYYDKEYRDYLPVMFLEDYGVKLQEIGIK